MCQYCSGQYWLVNNNNIVGQDVEVSEDYFSNGISSYTISMPASLQSNKSTVQCIAYNRSNPHVYSSKVHLLVQGKRQSCLITFPTQFIFKDVIYINNLLFIE